MNVLDLSRELRIADLVRHLRLYGVIATFVRADEKRDATRIYWQLMNATKPAWRAA